MDYQQNFSYREETEINTCVSNSGKKESGSASDNHNDKSEGGSAYNENKNQGNGSDKNADENVAQDIKTLQDNIFKNMFTYCKLEILLVIVIVVIYPIVALAILNHTTDVIASLKEKYKGYILLYIIIHTMIIAFTISNIYRYKKKSADQMIRILKTMIYREKYLNKYH